MLERYNEFKDRHPILATVFDLLFVPAAIAALLGLSALAEWIGGAL